MNDPSANSSDRGFIPFRAATALARGEEGAAAPAERVPPPLPPPPPGAATREAPRPPESGPAARAPRPPVLPAGAGRAEAWQALVDWCVEAGIAEGGLLLDRAGTILENRGELPVRDAAFLARNLCAGLAAAREAAGSAPSASALDLGGRWITGFAVKGAGDADVVAAIWGSAPLRSAVRTALGSWIATALARTG